MIPLRDNNPTRSFPIITILLIGLNVFAYFFVQLPADNTGAIPGQFTNAYSLVPYELTTGKPLFGYLHISRDGSTIQYVPVENSSDIPVGSNDIPEGPPPSPIWFTIFTAMFMHASILHLGGNMLYLWIFGNNVEDALGKIKFLFFYLLCGAIAALAQVAIDPQSLIPTLGASGAIAGVLGAYIKLWPDARVLTLVFMVIVTLVEISAFWVLGIWIVLQVIEGVTGLGGHTAGGVAYFAHIGGFVAGMILIGIFGGKRTPLPRRYGMR